MGGRRAILGMLLTAAALTAASADEPRADQLATREARINEMAPAEQQELLRRQERFNALPADEQDRLRKLQAAIDADPNAERLQRVLSQYHEWLKTLTPAQREELADMSPEQRVEQIKRLQKRQRAAREHAQRVELLSKQDMREIVKWTEDIVWRKRKDFLSAMNKGQVKSFEKTEPERQKRALLYRAMNDRARRERGGLNWIDPKDLARLSPKLSEPAQRELAAAADPPAQRKLVATWIGTALHGLEPWQGMRRPSPLAGDELVQFLQNELPPQQRERLLKMPREQMLEELRGMYFDRGRDLVPGGPPRRDGRPGGPKGDGRGKRGRPPSSSDEAPPRTETPEPPKPNATEPAVPTGTTPPSTSPPATSPPTSAGPAATDAPPSAPAETAPTEPKPAEPKTE